MYSSVNYFNHAIYYISSTYNDSIIFHHNYYIHSYNIYKYKIMTFKLLLIMIFLDRKQEALFLKQKCIYRVATFSPFFAAINCLSNAKRLPVVQQDKNPWNDCFHSLVLEGRAIQKGTSQEDFRVLLTFSFKCLWWTCPGSDGKESAINVGDLGSVPCLGRYPGEGNGNRFKASCLENPKDRGTWQASVHGITESDTIEQLTISLYFSKNQFIFINSQG